MSIVAFAIAAGQNTGGKNDATGAFLPGAQKFGKAYNCPWKQFDNTGARGVVKQRFFDTIDTYCPGGTNLFAYFGHGIPAGLASPNVYGDDIDGLLEVLRPKLSKPLVVMLYACSSGASQGFTGKLRAKLGGDVWVYGHTSVGHSFLNPDVSEEASGNSPTFRLLFPSGDDLRAAWAEGLKYTDLWLRFPIMDDGTVTAEVTSRRLLGTWEVQTGGTVRHYVFDTPARTWTLDSGDDVNDAPTGTVKGLDPKKHGAALDQGTWAITDRVIVAWNSGPTETWPLPLTVVGEQGMAGTVPLKARRLSHSIGHGHIQG